MFDVSERHVCKVLGQHRSTQRKRPRGRADEERLTADIIELVRQYGRYGYRRIAELLRRSGWLVNDKRVEHIWRREGLKVPAKQPKRKRLWFKDGSCIRLRAEHPNHVWSYDFMEDRTHDGRKIRLLNVVDEFTRECLAIRIDRRLNSTSVIDVLSDLFILSGVPGHVRSDNGPKFIAKAVQAWIGAVGAKTAYISPGSAWENGYIRCPAGKRSAAERGELQCPHARRVTERGAVLQSEGSTDHHRELAASLQLYPATLITWIQSTSAGSVRAEPRRVAVCALWAGSDGPARPSHKANSQPTFKLDHSMEADQSRLWYCPRVMLWQLLHHR